MTDEINTSFAEALSGTLRALKAERDAERQRAEWWERMEALEASFTDGRGNQFSTRQSRAELRDFMERQGDWALSTEGALCQADDGE